MREKRLLNTKSSKHQEPYSNDLSVTWKLNPQTHLCFLYTLFPDFLVTCSCLTLFTSASASTQFCADPETSNKILYSTFARTRPPDTQISKSVTSVLSTFKWNKVALIYSKTETATRDYEAVAKTIQATLTSHDIEVRFVDKWTSAYYHGYTENPFTHIVDKSYNSARSINFSSCSSFSFPETFSFILLFCLVSCRCSQSLLLPWLKLSQIFYWYLYIFECFSSSESRRVKKDEEEIRYKRRSQVTWNINWDDMAFRGEDAIYEVSLKQIFLLFFSI